MKNFIFALIISIAIHFILLINFKDISIKETHKKTLNDTTFKYTYISLANIKQPKEIKKVIKKVIEKKKKTIKKTIKRTIKKQIIKPKPQSKYKKVYKKNIKPAIRRKNKIKKSVFTIKEKEPKKELKKVLIKKIEKPIRQIPKTIVKEIVKQELILDLAKEYQELQQLDNLTKSYLKLYGNEYFTLSNEQRTYLKENLNIIGRITQEYLIYPSIAIRTKQSGTNIVEFILKPNGDISNLKITDSSSYSALDRNTIKTIKIAYKDYPKPTEDTKVKIYVKYILY